MKKSKTRHEYSKQNYKIRNLNVMKSDTIAIVCNQINHLYFPFSWGVDPEFALRSSETIAWKGGNILNVVSAAQMSHLFNCKLVMGFCHSRLFVTLFPKVWCLEVVGSSISVRWQISELSLISLILLAQNSFISFKTPC